MTMRRTALTAVACAALALAGCNQSGEDDSRAEAQGDPTRPQNVSTGDAASESPSAGEMAVQRLIRKPDVQVTAAPTPFDKSGVNSDYSIQVTGTCTSRADIYMTKDYTLTDRLMVQIIPEGEEFGSFMNSQNPKRGSTHTWHVEPEGEGNCDLYGYDAVSGNDLFDERGVGTTTVEVKIPRNLENT
ncbi:hypothetical protein [Corynebacterium glyciniphilum]|uniref:hypothetical protein n=1 Tax=Corynebacterium glyciniphilum TaxID=1404244 RepID=UPI0026511347|nr:hypothetical protein [Corynebacterium glyciniphilum]MDN6706417.1 hypothetical protein [Corynebacterium glyciniphilum]